MKKKYVISISIILIISISISICVFNKHKFSKKEEINPISENSNISNNLVSIMLEKEAETGNYEKSNEGFPTEGYVFNKELSKCINGSEINFENNEVVVKAIGTDKCYAYFDNIQVKNEFDYTGDYEEYIVPTTGTYKIKLWGASGNDDTYGGKGAYTSGNIKLEKDKKIYIYVGEHPSFSSGNCYNSNPNSSFNGSKLGACAGGGGAYYPGTGDYGGGLNCGKGVGTAEGYYVGNGATQKSINFGFSDGKNTCIAGNGYYSGEEENGANAGGGSSFISGYPGCDAIAESSTENAIVHTDQPIHYSDKVFRMLK